MTHMYIWKTSYIWMTSSYTGIMLYLVQIFGEPPPKKKILLEKVKAERMLYILCWRRNPPFFYRHICTEYSLQHSI